MRRTFDPDKYLPPDPASLRAFLSYREGKTRRLEVLRAIVADGFSVTAAMQLMRKHYGRAPQAMQASNLRRELRSIAEQPRPVPTKKPAWEPWVPLDSEIRARLSSLETLLVSEVRARLAALEDSGDETHAILVKMCADLGVSLSPRQVADGDSVA